jgi:hypothetical protein
MICVSKVLNAQAPFPKLYFNTHYGSGAFASNVSGNYNAAFGNYALNKNTSGNYNTAVGAWALYNSNSSSNVAVGRRAGYSTTSGAGNTALGTQAMQNNTTGLANVAVGGDAMTNNVGGYFNTAVGNSAGPAFGNNDLYNATAIGYYALNTANAQVRIGNEFVTDIGGHVSWSTLSDGRFKTDVKEDVAGLDFINKLRPVSYVLDEAALASTLRIPDSVKVQLQTGRRAIPRQTGFVAQEVEAIVKKGNYSFNGVNAPQNSSDRYSIRYAEFVVPLVKAVQELTLMIDKQNKEIESLKKQLGSSSDSIFENHKGRGAALQQNYPNPFSNQTEISMTVPDEATSANLIFYTLEGKQLKVMPLSNRGDFSVNVHSTDMKKGMYLYALIVDGKIVGTRRLVITGD